MTDTPTIGGTGEGTTLSATVGDPAKTTTDVIKKTGQTEKGSGR